jgi:hypothetical protein
LELGGDWKSMHLMIPVSRKIARSNGNFGHVFNQKIQGQNRFLQSFVVGLALRVTI